MPIRMVRSFQSSSKFSPWGERQQGGGSIRGTASFHLSFHQQLHQPSSADVVLLYLVLSQRVDQMSGLAGEITKTSEPHGLSEHRVKITEVTSPEPEPSENAYYVLCPVTARLKPVSLMWACIPWIVLPGAAPSRPGLNSLMISEGKGGKRNEPRRRQVFFFLPLCVMSSCLEKAELSSGI